MTEEHCGSNEAGNEQLMPISAEDVVIPVMGMSGSGKTTFISLCTQQLGVGVGNGLPPAPSGIAVHSFQYHNKLIHLIDTPAFDDAERSDYETLDEITFWLTAAYENSISISGIIYLHPITDTRVQGAALKSMNILKTLCGPENYRGLVMATTRWGEITQNQKSKAISRHQELSGKSWFWGDIKQAGGHVISISGTRNDALRIIKHILDQDRKFDLAFQRQLIVEGKSISQTDTGRLLYEAVISRYEEDLESLQAAKNTLREEAYSQHPQQKAELDAEKRKLEQSLRLQDEAVQKLNMNAQSLREAWNAQLSRGLEYMATLDTVSSRTGIFKEQTNTTEHRQNAERVRIIEPVIRMSDTPTRNSQGGSSRKTGIQIAKTTSDSSYTTWATVGTALGAGQLMAAMLCVVM